MGNRSMKKGFSRCSCMYAFICSLCIAILSIGSASAQTGCGVLPDAEVNPGPLNYYECAPPNDYKCTANDVNAYEFKVTDEDGNTLSCLDCVDGYASGYVNATFAATAGERYNIFFIFGLDKDGDGVITETDDEATNEQYRVALAPIIEQDCIYQTQFPITWPCNVPLYLVGPSSAGSECGAGGPVLHWDNNKPTSPYDGMDEYACSPSSKCKCYSPFTVPAPCLAYAVDFSICQGTEVTDSTFYDAGASCTAGCSATITKSTDFDPNVPGKYTYTITCATGGCSDTDTGEVTVNPLPIAVDDYYTTDCLGSLKVPAPGVLGNDTGSNLEAELATTVTGGTLSLSKDGSFTYSAYAGTSSDSFTYKANNTTTGCYDIGTVYITVQRGTLEITCPDPITLSCLDEIPAPDPANVTATGCGEVKVEWVNDTVVSGDGCATPKIINRFYNATDQSGNIEECIQVITVQDTTAPVLSGCPTENPTVECNAVPDPVTVNATDNCDATVTVDFNEVKTAGDCANNYTLTRYWNATDVCGNIATCIQLITVTDTQAPLLPELPKGGDLGCNPTPPTCVEGLKATDNCDGEIDVTCTPGEIVEEGAKRTQVFTYSAIDSCGNLAESEVTYTWIESNPAIHIDKRADVTSAKPGQTINYTYNVTNTGNVDLSSVEVTDDNLDVNEVEVKLNSIDSGGDEQ